MLDLRNKTTICYICATLYMKFVFKGLKNRFLDENFD